VPPALPSPTPAAGSPWEPLVDAQGRALTYLRLSVTDRCNFRCGYCSPGAWAGRANLLDEAELVRLASLFVRLGVRKVRLTGGEPLLRPDLLGIVRGLRALPGLTELCLTTNGHLLARHAQDLKAAGVDRVNVSIDSLDADRFRTLTGGQGDLPQVLAGIDAALAAGLAVKVNTVVLDGQNYQDVVPIIRWAWGRGIVPRFIECMPFASGRPVPTLQLVERLRAQGLSLASALEARDGQAPGPSEYWRGEGGLVGFIGALTRNFCERCNRVRVAANGNVHACLGGTGSLPMAPLLRSQATDDELAQRLREALLRKPDGHCMTAPDARARLASMMGIGG
jgi:cyclic pyranopterin phosphate synthase